MASKYVKCPQCGLKSDGYDLEPMDGCQLNTAFEVECERCKTCFEVTPVKFITYYEAGKITHNRV